MQRQVAALLGFMNMGLGALILFNPSGNGNTNADVVTAEVVILTVLGLALAASSRATRAIVKEALGPGMKTIAVGVTRTLGAGGRVLEVGGGYLRPMRFGKVDALSRLMSSDGKSVEIAYVSGSSSNSKNVLLLSAGGEVLAKPKLCAWVARG